MKDIFPRRLKKLRLNAEKTQEDIANALKIQRTTYSEYERGNVKPPIDKIEQMAAVLGVTPQFLLGWDNEIISSAAEVEADKNADADFDKMYDEWKASKATGLGEHIKALRQERHFTLIEMSKELSIPVVTLKEYESGTRKIPYSVIKKMAEYFDIEIEMLYGIEFETESEEKIKAGIRRLKMAERWSKEFGKTVFREAELEEIINFTKYIIYKRNH